MKKSKQKPAQLRQRLFIRFFQVSFILAMLYGSFYIFTIRDQLVEWSSYGYFGVFFINLIGNASLIVPIPSPLSTIVAANIFDPLTVGIVSGLGAAIGEMTSYFTGRAGTFVVEKQKIFKWLEKLMLKNQWLVIFFLALVPNPFFDLTGILAGVLRIPIKFFFPVMLLGKILKFVILAYLSVEVINITGLD